MNGALASLARRRAISVLPTPVGPIMRMFFGVISWRRFSATCCRRQRLRSAMATARFAAFWPTMCLSNSSTISRGVICDIGASEFLDRQVSVGIYADICSDVQRSLHDLACGQIGSLQQRQRCGLGIAAAGADGDHVMLRFDHVAISRYDIRAFGIRDTKQCLEPAQAAIAAPVLGQFDRSAGQVAEFLQLALEALEQCERVGGAPGKSCQHLAAVQPADFPRIALHDALSKGDLTVAADGDPAIAPDGENGGSVNVIWMVIHVNQPMWGRWLPFQAMA